MLSNYTRRSFDRVLAEEDDSVFHLVPSQPASHILDVGCGQGRYLIPLVKQGHDVVGIDANPVQIERLVALGYQAQHSSELGQIPDESFDIVLMSHLIEHIQPGQLIGFMDSYIDKLKRNGLLIIATPLLYDEFFDDYDHIRPYTPKAIRLLYSDYPQHQEKPQHRLELRSVWFRRWPYYEFPLPGMPTMHSRLMHLSNILRVGVFHLSGRTVGRVTGWVGAFEKRT